MNKIQNYDIYICMFICARCIDVIFGISTSVAGGSHIFSFKKQRDTFFVSPWVPMVNMEKQRYLAMSARMILQPPSGVVQKWEN
jgi:hypothetical protein